MSTLNLLSKKRYLTIVRCIVILFMTMTPEILFAIESHGVQTPVNKSPVELANVLQIITYLVLVIFLIIGSAWLFRRYGRINSAANGELKIVSGLSVGQRERILLVEMGGIRLLLGVAPGHVQTLHVLDGEFPVKDQDVEQESFVSRINDEIRKKMLS